MGVFNIILCVILLCHVGIYYRCTATTISIKPPNTVAGTANDVRISCLPNGDDNNGKQLTLIELSRNDQDTIVFVSQCGKISYAQDSSNKFKATGHIDEDPNKSYLNITLLNPVSQDTGRYTCVMVYLNTEGHLETEKVTGHLLVENLDLKKFEGVLNKMDNRIASLERENGDLHEKVFVLEQVNTNQSIEFAAFKDKVMYNTFFMVTNNLKKNKPRTGTVIVFPDLITMRGTDYDMKTGVFTSPVYGLYAFQLVSTTRTGCRFNVELMANDAVLAKLFAHDQNDWDQSSISSVIELKAGDKVFCKAISSCDMHEYRFTVFTGYLVKAL